ncbi:MAG: substrate-binding domain-containing protein, partial [Bacteroidota bacterium]
AISEEKLNIPDDISVVAFDDMDFAPFLITPLTAVRQPREFMGEAAVKLLIDEIKTKDSVTKKKIVLEPKLIIRKSVRNGIPDRVAAKEVEVLDNAVIA